LGVGAPARGSVDPRFQIPLLVEAATSANASPSGVEREPGEKRVEFDAEGIGEAVHDIQQAIDYHDVESLLFAEMLARAIEVGLGHRSRFFL
jgi:hypothetical protein